MRYVDPYSYDSADDYWDAVDEEIEREEARASLWENDDKADNA